VKTPAFFVGQRNFDSRHLEYEYRYFPTDSELPNNILFRLYWSYMKYYTQKKCIAYEYIPAFPRSSVMLETMPLLLQLAHSVHMNCVSSLKAIT
jgi:hypothetical protein